MDWALFSGVLVAVAIGIVWLFAFGAVLSRPVADDRAALLLRHSLWFRGFALVAILGMTLFLTIMAFVSPPKEDEVWIVFVVVGGFVVLGLPLIWESMRFGLIVVPEGLDCRSPWRGARFLTWDEVEAVRFGGVGSWFIVRAKDRWKFRVPLLVPGLSRFLEQCERHLPLSALEEARAGYDRVGRPFPGEPEPRLNLDLTKWNQRRRR
jgi:hypothetical protein